ncbi:MAG: glycosyltransferase [Verrucomicrobiales bacterium]
MPSTPESSNRSTAPSRGTPSACRRAKIIAFGAVRGNSDKNKGFDLLTDALDSGLPREEVHLLVFGAPRGPVDGLPYPATSVGVARDEISLAVLYNAADVVAVPSRVESFGQTASEPLACGTPAVAFDASALPEIIDHRENGYLAKAYDPADFAAGLRWVLESPERHRQLADAGREKACRTFSQELVAARTKAIYASMSESTAA